MKHLKTISALILALMMVLTMGTSVFADDTGSAAANKNTMTVKKVISVINHDGYAYEPGFTYTYTLSDGTAGGTVNDGKNTVNLKAGSVSYLAGGSDAVQTAVFDKANAVSGSEASRDMSWEFDPQAFPSAGVYRFVLTETSDDPASIGIERPENYDTSKFLDVYVQNNGSAKEIYSFILVDDASAVTAEASKSQGWNAGNDLDKYETYNITITNKATGALADTTAAFPYTVTLGGRIDAANIAVEGAGFDETNANIVKGNLKSEETMTIKGLPKTATFAVSESNPTPDTYKTTSTVAGVNGTENAANADFEGGASLDVVTGGNVSTAAETAISIEVANNLDSISPTNVVMRFAPYLFILGGAVVLLMASRRRKAEQE
ncbi:MAG: hypothetical protein IJI87_03485 [Mogibacterium sp.]|nr:hypothetical protein [Mogibacterium sp.]